jgi:hypothetical protein
MPNYIILSHQVIGSSPPLCDVCNTEVVTCEPKYYTDYLTTDVLGSLAASPLIIDQPHQKSLAACKVAVAKSSDVVSSHNQAISTSYKRISSKPPAIDAGTKGGGHSSYDGARINIRGQQHAIIITAAGSRRNVPAGLQMSARHFSSLV